MAMESGLFRSVNRDRTYKASFFAEYFGSLVGNGVFAEPGDGLQVMTNNDMTVTVKYGKCWINGYFGINREDEIKQIDPADGVLNRVDRIVLRWSIESRDIQIVVKKGTFASSPVAPTLQRDADAYELALADINVNKGIVSISQANITDLRMNADMCGIVHGLIDQMDPTTLFLQYQAWIAEKKEEFDTDLIDYTNMKHDEIDGIISDFQSEFMTWFDTIRDILDENVAGNLELLIEDLNNRVDGIEEIFPRKADLDENDNVPESQLNNVQYLKDFYGKRSLPFAYDPKIISPAYAVNRNFEFNYFDFVARENAYNSGVLPGIPGGASQLSVLVSNTAGGETASNSETRAEGGVNVYHSITGASGTARQALLTFCTTLKYDVTDVDYIDVTGRIIYLSAPSHYIGVGLSDAQTYAPPNIVSTPIDIVGNNLSARLDVRGFTGDYYIKISSYINRSAGSSAGLNFHYGMKSLIMRRISNKAAYSPVDNAFRFADYTSEVEIEIPLESREIPAGFLDWYNLNALVDTPPGTSVDYAIYDNHDVLIKDNIKNGDILKLTNPIIKPKVTLRRDSTDVTPVFNWLEVGARGIAEYDNFSLVNRFTLEANAVQVDVEIPEYLKEAKIVLKNILGTSASVTTAMYLRVNSLTTNIYSYNVTGYISSSQSGERSNNTAAINLRDAIPPSNLPRNASRLDVYIDGLSEGEYANGELSLNAQGPNLYLAGSFSINKTGRVLVVNLISANAANAMRAGTIVELWGR